MSKVIEETGNEVEDFYPGLFARALKVQDVNSLIVNALEAAPVVYLGKEIQAIESQTRP